LLPKTPKPHKLILNMVNLLSLLTSTLLLAPTSAVKCKNKPYPIVFGGTDGDTILTCLVLKTDNLLAMGTTDSDTVYGSAASASPIVVKFQIETPALLSAGKFTAVTYS